MVPNITSIMENQMEKKMENEMEAGIIKGLARKNYISRVLSRGVHGGMWYMLGVETEVAIGLLKTLSIYHLGTCPWTLWV